MPQTNRETCLFPLVGDRLFSRLVADGYQPAKALAEWKDRVRHHWREVRVVHMEHVDVGDLQVGTELRVEAEVALGTLSPEEVLVQL